MASNYKVKQGKEGKGGTKRPSLSGERASHPPGPPLGSSPAKKMKLEAVGETPT